MKLAKVSSAGTIVTTAAAVDSMGDHVTVYRSVPHAAVTTTASMDVATLSSSSSTAAVLIQQQQHHHLQQQQQQGCQNVLSGGLPQNASNSPFLSI